MTSSTLMDTLHQRPGTGPAIVGRACELAAIDAVLESGGALVLNGPPGIGLSTLVAEAAERAAGRSALVLRASGVQAETELAYAGLHQLLRPLRRRLRSLPDDDALAQVLSGAGAPATDAVAASMAAIVSSDKHVVLCVDDADWLDGATRHVIAALNGPRTSLIVASRSDLDEPDVELAPLAADDAAALLEARHPDLDPFVRMRVLDAAAGSPLALVELPSALRDASDGALLSPWLPVPDRLARSFAPGLEQLPAATRRALLAAALGDGRLHGTSSADLGPAIDAALVAIDEGGRARFSHELTRAAVVSTATIAERDATHRALAGIAGDPDRQVLHRAACAVGTDDALADALAAVARRIEERGDYRHAAAAQRRAARLTADPRMRSRRLVVAADIVREVGGTAIAERLLAEVDAGALDPAGLGRLAVLRDRTQPGRAKDDAASVDVVALADSVEAAGDPDAALRLLQRTVARILALDPHGAAVGVLVAAAERIAAPGDPRLVSILAAVDPVRRGDEILAAVAARDHAHDAPAETLVLLGHAAVTTGDPAAAERLLGAASDTLLAERRVEQRIRVLPLLAWAQLAMAHWDATERTALEAAALARDVRQPIWGAVAAGALGMLAGLRGDEEAAESYLADAEGVALPARASAVIALVHHARGLTALSSGRPAEAYDHLLRLHPDRAPAYNQASPIWSVADLAEAAMTGPHRDRARAVLAAVEPLAAVTPAPQVRIVIEHARLVLAEGSAADAAFAASASVDMSAWPFHRARMDLAHGMRLRRLRRVGESREPLSAALETFDRLGARPWADRASAELAATARSSHRGDDVLEQLTPQELEIARLAAQGMTNREIGERLALSHRTVGSHLGRAFPKLGIRSRAEIAAALERRGEL